MKNYERKFKILKLKFLKFGNDEIEKKRFH